MNLKSTFLTLIALSALPGAALAQKATPEQMLGLGEREGYKTLHMKSNLGSFKMYGEGAVTLNFSGTLLVSQLEGKIEFAGDVKKEYEGLGRQVFHGKGQAKITGKWRAIQWFGSDMDAVWWGNGFVRLVGEFDRDLKTGEYWYDDPDFRKPWQIFLFEVYLPELVRNVAPGTPVKRGEGG